MTEDIKKDILWRVYLVYFGILIMALAIIGKAAYIQFAEGKELIAKAERQELRFFNIEANRGNIYDENAKGVFNGKVIVRQDAQKTNAFQQNNNVLLSDKASVDTKPQLEIFADDVKCSHGCTVGQLDEEALFYLRSRGIPEREAKALLMYAFSSDALNYVRIPELRRRLNIIMSKKLGVDLEFSL